MGPETLWSPWLQLSSDLLSPLGLEKYLPPGQPHQPLLHVQLGNIHPISARSARENTGAVTCTGWGHGQNGYLWSPSSAVCSTEGTSSEKSFWNEKPQGAFGYSSHYSTPTADHRRLRDPCSDPAQGCNCARGLGKPTRNLRHRAALCGS